MSESQPSSPWRNGRVWAAFAVLPVMNTVLGYAIGNYVQQQGHVYGDVAGLFAFFAALFSFLVTLVGAVPFVFSRMQRGPISLMQLLVAGALLGNAPLAVYVLGLILPATVAHLIGGTLSEHLVPFSDLFVSTLRIVIGGSILGAWSAFVFWFIARRQLA